MMVFNRGLDRENERVVAAQMEAAFKCTVHDFGSLNDVDFWLEKDGALAAYVEMKTRTQSSTKFPTVYLSIRKWLAMNLLSVGVEVPCLFVVKFSDEVRWINLKDVDARSTHICERSDHRAANDREPVVLVPVSDMTILPELVS